MAEINVQRKSSNALWWVLGIVALVLVAWFLFAWMGGDTQRVSIALTGEPYAAAVTAFMPAS
jgi:hypothetical protein